MTVLFTSVPHLITQIKECRSEKSLHLLETKLKKYDLVIANGFGNVVACFETLKSDLDIRPIFQQKDEATRHTFIWQSLPTGLYPVGKDCQMKKKGVSLTWRELLRIMGTQSVASTRAKRADGNEVEVRQCIEPEQRLADIYLKLNLNSPPLKRRRKICVVHLENIKKIVLENQRVRWSIAASWVKCLYRKVFSFCLFHQFDSLLNDVAIFIHDLIKLRHLP